MATLVERRGRPRKWNGPLAEWMIATGIRAEALADAVDVDLSTVYRWFRGEQSPTYDKALVIAEIARSVGPNLTVEEIYAQDVGRIRHRHWIRNSLPPL
jgi:transcriptional regulator with XRE-family HTH domain